MQLFFSRRPPCVHARIVDAEAVTRERRMAYNNTAICHLSV